MELSNTTSNKEIIRAEYVRMMGKLSEERKKVGMMIVGGTHFKQERKKVSSSNYTLIKIIKECIDNICYKCKNVCITYKLSSDGYLKSFTISDDYELGFEDINKEGTDNPFNFTHMREGHNSDTETSQFGTGFKSAAASSCEMLKTYTRVDGKFHLIVCDFPKMESEPIPAFSFDPESHEVTENEYSRVHQYPTGSTLIFEDIFKKVHGRTNVEKLGLDMMNKLSECYSDIIKGNDFNIYIEGKPVQPEYDFSNDPRCKPFTINGNFIKYLDKDDTTCEAYVYEDICDNGKEYYIFNSCSQNWNKMKPGELAAFGLVAVSKKKPSIKWIVDKTISYSDKENECMRFRAIFMMYHPYLNTENIQENEARYPKGRTRIYGNGRCYGIWGTEGTDGNSNFTDIRIDYKSKKIGNELGITWNKDITGEQENDLCIAVKKLLKKIKSELNGNTSSDRNKYLYEKALKNKIFVPERRRPTDIKKEEKEKKEVGLKKLVIVDSDNETTSAKKEELKEEPRNNVLQSFMNFQQKENVSLTSEIPDENVLVAKIDAAEEKATFEAPIIATVVEQEKATFEAPIVVPIVAEEKATFEAPIVVPIVAEEKATFEAPIVVPIVAEEKAVFEAPIVVPIVEKKTEPTNLDLVIEEIEEIEEIQENTDNTNETIRPQLIKVSETVHTTINVKEGKKILNILKDDCSETYNEDIVKIIISYCDRCAPDQITLALKYMSYSKKIEFLLELIKERYNSEKEEILGGSRLNTIFMNLQN